MRKIFLKIALFFKFIGLGLRGADKSIMPSKPEENGGAPTGIEEQEEQESVYADLLRGEVTQQVKELRHEMYFAERKSHEYGYSGGGRAKRKNTMLDTVDGIENEDGYDIMLIQENREDMQSLKDFGIHNVGENVFIEQKANEDLGNKDKRDFTIKIERDFIPNFRIERFVTKLVVKRISEKEVVLDFYVPKYRQQFDNVDKLFNKQIENIYNGIDRRNDMLYFTSVSFVTYRAYGSDDLKFYKFNVSSFDKVLEYNGSYIIRFYGEIDGSEDLIAQYYDEIADEKSKNHEMRNPNATISFDNAEGIMNLEQTDTTEQEKLIKELNTDAD